MRTFILRALKAKTDWSFDLDSLPKEGRLDLVCRFISNCLFISNNLRKDTIVKVCLDGPSLQPKLIIFNGETLKGIEPDERNIANHIKNALKKARNLKLNEFINLNNGIIVKKQSFEALVKEEKNLIYLHKKGLDIRKFKFEEDNTFVFGDYIGMPRKTEKLLDRLNAKRISLGPIMLFASHCPVIIHNELDRLGPVV